MDTMWLRYIGERSPFRDNLWRTGWWKTGQNKKVLAWAGERLLRHPDMFEVGSGSDGGSGGGYDDTELRNKIRQAETALANKVDKVSGKGLSTNDFTAADKAKLDSLSPYDDSALANRVAATEAALGGHSVRANVPANAKFTDTVYDDTAIRGLLDGKVDKVSGKQLSTEDYTTAERTKLANLANVKSIGKGLELSTAGELTAKVEDTDTKPELSAALTAGRELGGVAEGTLFPAGTSLEAIIRALLSQSQAPPQPTNDAPLWSNAVDNAVVAVDATPKSAGSVTWVFAPQTEESPEIFDVPADWTVTAVDTLNEITNQFQRCKDFVVSDTTHEVNGQTVAYKRYTDDRGYDAGSRTIRVTWEV